MGEAGAGAEADGAGDESQINAANAPPAAAAVVAAEAEAAAAEAEEDEGEDVEEEEEEEEETTAQPAAVADKKQAETKSLASDDPAMAEFEDEDEDEDRPFDDITLGPHTLPLHVVVEQQRRRDPGFKLAKALAPLKPDGSWVAHGRVSYDVAWALGLPGIKLGAQRASVRLPVDLDADAPLLAKLQQDGVLVMAPFGHGNETKTDATVRSTLQASPEHISFTNDAFSDAISSLAERVADMLGMEDSRVRASLHKLLIYRPGDHFKAHRDAVHEPGMFGTLIVELPSVYEGGELTLKHGGETVEVAHPNDGSSVFFTALYADVEHQVHPITSGARVVLTYNLIVEDGHKSLKAPAPLPADSKRDIVAALRSMVSRDPDASSTKKVHVPRPVVLVPCEHLYPRNLFGGESITTRSKTAWPFAVAQLKGADRVRARALAEAAASPELRDLDMVVGIGHVHVDATGLYPGDDVPVDVTASLSFTVRDMYSAVLEAERTVPLCGDDDDDWWFRAQSISVPRANVAAVSTVAALQKGMSAHERYAKRSAKEGAVGDVRARRVAHEDANEYTGNEAAPEEAEYDMVGILCAPRKAFAFLVANFSETMLGDVLPLLPGNALRDVERATVFARWTMYEPEGTKFRKLDDFVSLMRHFPELSEEWLRGPVGLPPWLVRAIESDATAFTSHTGDLVQWLARLSVATLKALPYSPELSQKLRRAVADACASSSAVRLAYEEFREPLDKVLRQMGQAAKMRDYWPTLWTMARSAAAGGFLSDADRVVLVEWFARKYFGPPPTSASALGTGSTTTTTWDSYKVENIARMLLEVMIHAHGNDDLVKAAVGLVGAVHGHSHHEPVEAGVTEMLLKKWLERTNSSNETERANGEKVRIPEPLGLVLRTFVEGRIVDIETRVEQDTIKGAYSLRRGGSLPWRVDSFLTDENAMTVVLTEPLSAQQVEQLRSLMGGGVVEVSPTPGSTFHTLTKNREKCRAYYLENNPTLKALRGWAAAGSDPSS